MYPRRRLSSDRWEAGQLAANLILAQAPSDCNNLGDQRVYQALVIGPAKSVLEARATEIIANGRIPSVSPVL